MDIAIVIGGNIGIGLSISRKLITLGFRVYAIASDFTKTPFAHKDFFPITINLSDVDALRQAAEGILNKEDSIYTIINAPEKVLNGPFNSISPLNLQIELTQYLLNPILLTRLTIGKIREFQGFIINIYHEDLLNPLNQAIEGGLSSFYASLFEDYRTHGVNITNILIQSKLEAINSEMIANTVDHLIRFKGGNAITKIFIRPQGSQASIKFPQITPSVDEFKEIQLPTKHNFPPEPESIPTQQPKTKKRTQKPTLLKTSSTPKISRETVIIPRERKKRPIENPAPIKPIQGKSSTNLQKIHPKPNLQKRPSPKPTSSNLNNLTSNQTTTRITKEHVIIRSRKPRMSKAEIKEDPQPEINSEPLSTSLTQPPTRIRRGRPIVKKES